MKEKPRLLALVQLPPPVHGASLMNSYLLASNQLSEAFDVDTIPLRFVSKVSEIGSITGTKLLQMVKIGWRILAKILVKKPQLVYLTLSPVGNAFYRDFVYVMLVKLCRVPLVYHLHGKGIADAVAGDRLKRAVYRFVFKNANVICLSDILTGDIKGVFNGVPYVVPNGIPLVDISQGQNPDSPYPCLVYLSNLSRSKGLFVLLEALSILRNEKVSFQAKLIGAPHDVSYDEVKKFLLENNLDDVVSLMGPKYGDQKFEELATADIFLFPTFYEAFPIVVLEAMMCGLPVVATDEASIPAMVEDGYNGFLVKHRDPEALAEKIKRLINDPDLRKKMGRRGRERFLEHYTISSFENKMTEVLKDILRSQAVC